jgi:type III pantothenate kinase
MKYMRIIAIDIGNTSMTCAVVFDGKVIRKRSVPVSKLDEKYLKNFGFLKMKCDAIVVGSVVPKISKLLSHHFKSISKQHVFFIGKDIKVPIVNKTDKPSQVGVDRLIAAFEAYRTYKGRCIVVDFGTAITFDVVSKKGEYMGGLITPGIELSLNALAEKTALLPRIRLKHPSNLVGKNTVESIRSGCAYGIGSLCDGVIDSLMKFDDYHSRATCHSRESGNPHKKYKVIATGGYAKFISKYSSRIKTIVPDLILKGIYNIFTFSG